MLRLDWTALVAVTLAALARGEQGDAARYLRDLSSPSVELRAEAGRWLARHLSIEDLDVVLEATLRGDAESNRRLVEALADDDRHLGLAIAIGSRAEPIAVETGREAIVELVARWQPGLDRAGLAQAELLEWLAERSDEPLSVGARGRSLTLAVALDELARFSPTAIPIVIAPELDASAELLDSRNPSGRRGPRGEVVGRLDVVLAELAAHHAVRMDGFGIDDDRPAALQPWIYVYPANAQESARTGADLLVEWCLAAAKPGGRGAARALASAGWPAALAWLESRWRASADPIALEGVLLAARRGRVAPALFDPAVQRDLYGRMSSASAKSGLADLSLAQDIARALAATGASGAGGADLAALALEGFDAASVRERWLRLVVLEAHARGAPQIDALIAAPPAPSMPPALRFQALRARASACLGPAASRELVTAAGGRELCDWLESAGMLEQGLPALCDSRTRPSEDLRDPGPLSSGVRAVAIEWWFAAQDCDAVAIHVVESGRPLDAIAAQARRWVRAGRADLWRACLDAARRRAGANVDAIDWLAIQSGAADPSLRGRWLERWLARTPEARDELLALAALAAGERGEAVRAAIVGSMRGPAKPDDIADALTAAWSVLVASRRDEDERAFVKAERAALREAPDALRERLRQWPGRLPAEPRRTSELDRRLDLAGP